MSILTHTPFARMPIIALVALLPLAMQVNCAAQSEDSEPAAGSDEAELQAARGLFGNLVSKQCERIDASTFQQREYHFGSSTSVAFWDRFSSPTCAAASKTMTIQLDGHSKFTGFSHTTFAVELTAFIDKKTITPTAQGVALLTAACPGHAWVAGAPQVVTTGCGRLLQQDDVCPAEYDLLKITTSGIYFGDRSKPLCSDRARPTRLTPWAVVFE